MKPICAEENRTVVRCQTTLCDSMGALASWSGPYFCHGSHREQLPSRAKPPNHYDLQELRLQTLTWIICLILKNLLWNFLKGKWSTFCEIGRDSAGSRENSLVRPVSRWLNLKFVRFLDVWTWTSQLTFLGLYSLSVKQRSSWDSIQCFLNLLLWDCEYPLPSLFCHLKTRKERNDNNK